MAVDINKVKEIRDKTGISVIECKRALETAQGDIEKAMQELKKKGLDVSRKKQGRETKEGVIGSYVHLNNKIGVMLEVNCESDFVARNEDFTELVKNLALHITATSPTWIKKEEVPEEALEEEREIVKAQFKNKPEKVIEQITEGKIKDFYKDCVLLEQPFVKDPAVTIKDYIDSVIAKLGENIQVKRFVKYEVGE